mgnify:CR=1 FL=1
MSQELLAAEIAALRKALKDIIDSDDCHRPCDYDWCPVAEAIRVLVSGTGAGQALLDRHAAEIAALREALEIRRISTGARWRRAENALAKGKKGNSK